VRARGHVEEGQVGSIKGRVAWRRTGGGKGQDGMGKDKVLGKDRVAWRGTGWHREGQGGDKGQNGMGGWVGAMGKDKMVAKSRTVWERTRFL
jgi:hypothetical protein